MPRALLRNQRDHVETALRAGCNDLQTLAEEAGCSTSQVVKMRANLARFDSVVRPKFVVQGRPRSLTPAIEQVGYYILQESSITDDKRQLVKP